MWLAWQGAGVWRGNAVEQVGLGVQRWVVVLKDGRTYL